MSTSATRSATGHKTSLLTLPMELLEAVADGIDGQDVKNMRLVCRELHRACDKTFLRTFFSRRRHLITKYSLETLVDITASPRLRSKLQSIVFVNVDMDLSHLSLPGDFSPGRIPGESDEEWERRLWKRSEDLKERRNAVKEERKRLQGTWHALKNDFHNHGMDLTLFCRALQNLKQAAICPRIEIYGLDRHYPSGFGLRDISKNLNADMGSLKAYLNGYQHGEQRIKDLLQCLAEAAFQVQHFSSWEFDSSAGLASALGDPEWRQELTFAFANLKSLELNMRCIGNWSDGTFVSFKQLTNSSSSLESINFMFDCYTDGGITWHRRGLLGKIGDALAQNRLKSLEISGIGRTTVTEVWDMVKVHKETLQVLRLSSAMIGAMENPDWEHLWLSLAKELALREVYFDDLNHGDYELEGFISFEGQDAVKVGLQNLARSTKWEERY